MLERSQSYAAAALLVLIASCGSPETNANGLLFTNGQLLAAPPGSSVLVRDGLIAAVGDSADLVRSFGAPSVVVDLTGATLAPAFVDHHVHLVNVGFALLNARDDQRLFLDVSDVTSLDELAERIRNRARSTPTGQWILGAGWSQAGWGTQALPTHEVLTRAAPEHPVYLARIDGHAGWVNAATMRLAGLDVSTLDPRGGKIVRSKDGRPTGVLLEGANEAVIGLIPQPSDDDIKTAFRLATNALAARGVVEAYDAGFLPFPGVVALDADLGRYLRLLRTLDDEQPLSIVVDLMIPAPSQLADSLINAQAFESTLSPRVRITHLKLFADGALGSRGAALGHPYGDDATTHGVLRMNAEEIHPWSKRALAVGLGVATHAIGDEAVRQALDAYERLLREEPSLDPRRLRIEHFSYARPEDFERAVELGIVLSIQSNFNSAPGESPTFGERRVGRAGMERVYAWRKLHAMGARLAEGSDYFTLPGPTLMAYHAALTRQLALGRFGEGEAGRLPAFELATSWFPPDGGAKRMGRIAPGAPAHLVVLSANPLTAPEDSLLAVRALATFRDGEIVYEGALSAHGSRWRLQP